MIIFAMMKTTLKFAIMMEEIVAWNINMNWMRMKRKILKQFGTGSVKNVNAKIQVLVKNVIFVRVYQKYRSFFQLTKPVTMSQ